MTRRKPVEVLADVQRLKGQGVLPHDVARILGISLESVRCFWAPAEEAQRLRDELAAARRQVDGM